MATFNSDTSRQGSQFSDDINLAALLSPRADNPNEIEKWNVNPGGTLTYSFVTVATANTYEADETETNIAEVTAPIKQNVREIFQQLYSAVIPINFVEVPDSPSSNIRIMFSDGPATGEAYAYTLSTPGVGGAIHLSASSENDPAVASSGRPGSYGYSTLIHEIGHTLGLKHPGNYNALSEDGPEAGPFLPFDRDHHRNTVMSYNPTDAGLITPGTIVEAGTLMVYDIQALQFLYGTRTDFNSGDNVYSFTPENFYQVATLWDGGGIDFLDFSGLPATDSYVFNLNPGEVSTARSALNALSYNLIEDQGAPVDQVFTTHAFGTYLALGVQMENLIGSPGNDEIIGNGLGNLIFARAGDDSVQAGGGNDIVYGGRGNDQVFGGDGDDILFGDMDNDIIEGGAGNDIIYGGKGDDQLIGGEGDDILFGDLGNDILRGGPGRDQFVLAGGRGIDTILDFEMGIDLIALSGGLTFEQLVITADPSGAVIAVGSEPLAIVNGIDSTTVASPSFVVIA